MLPRPAPPCPHRRGATAGRLRSRITGSAPARENPNLAAPQESRTHMDGKRLIRSIKLTNLLSFGPDGMEIELQPFNVLIGANGSGKSNFVDALSLLQHAESDFSKPFQEVDDNAHWFWKGDSDTFKAEMNVGLFIKFVGHDYEHSIKFRTGSECVIILSEVAMDRSALFASGVGLLSTSFPSAGF